MATAGAALAEHRCRFVIEERQHRQAGRTLPLLLRCANTAAAAVRFRERHEKAEAHSPGRSTETCS